MEEEVATLVPLGFYFQPKDEDLIQYLKNKIEGVPVDPCIVKDFDIYSTEPWNLPHERFPFQREETEMYFFCQRKHSGTGSRVKRTAGSGHWHGYGSNKPIKKPSGEVVGHKTTNLSFMTAQRDITHWVMDEYRLPSEQHIVLCKIRMSARGKSKLKRKGDEVLVEHSPSPTRRRTECPNLLVPSSAEVTENPDQYLRVSTMQQQQEPQESTAEVFYRPEHAPIYQKLLQEWKKQQQQYKTSSTAESYQFPEPEYRHQQQQEEFAASSCENPYPVVHGYHQQIQEETWDAAVMDQFRDLPESDIFGYIST